MATSWDIIAVMNKDSTRPLFLCMDSYKETDGGEAGKSKKLNKGSRTQVL